MSLKKFPIFLIVQLYLPAISWSQNYSYVLSKSRPAQLHIEQYKQIAVGDIVGPAGAKTEKSMDFTDALTAKLFNSNKYEVVDRNALADLVKQGENGIIDEKTITALKKQLKSAMLITGRVQSSKIDQKMYSKTDILCPGNTTYYWQVTGEEVVQLKLMDVNTGKMFYSGPVTVPIQVRSVNDCAIKNKFDVVPIQAEAFEKLTDEVVKLLIPFNEQIRINFKNPVMVMGKNPFKDLRQVVSFFEIGDFEKGNSVLKRIAEESSLKKNQQAMAHYNYALGLYCTGRYEEAKAELKKAIELNTSDFDFQVWHGHVEKEEAAEKAGSRLAKKST